jgi:hypothetical protein
MLKTNFEQCTTLLPKAEKRSSAFTQTHHISSHAIEDICSSTKVVRNDFLEKRIELLEKKLEEFEEAEKRKFKCVSETVKSLKDNLEHSIEHKEKQINLKLGNLLLVEEKMIGSLQSDIKNRKHQETKILKHLDDKICGLKGDLTREALERNESIEWTKKALDVDIPRVSEDVKSQSKLNEEFINGLVNKFNPEIQNLVQTLENERIGREEHENAVMDMKNDILDRARKEIDQEHNERLAFEENLYYLLDSACSKINAVI